MADRDVTTIECPRKLQGVLNAMKTHPRESYASVILRLIPKANRPEIPPELYPLKVRIRKKEEVIE